MRRTGPTNPQLSGLIVELKKKAIKDNVDFWKRIASDLERPARDRRAVNLSRINRFTKENTLVIVPGKVLGSGFINHKVTIAALDFSAGAIEKLRKQNCDTISIMDLMARNPKASDVRIIG